MSADATNRRRVLLASVGSYGDVFPFVSWGSELKRRGHDVTVLTSGYFTDVVENAGLKIAPAGTREQYEAYVTNPNLIYPLRGMRLTQKILEQIIQPIYTYIQNEWLTPDSIIAASPYCMGARIAQEIHSISLLTVNIAPISLGSTVDPPTITPLLSPSRLPKVFRHTFGPAMHWVTDRFIGKSVNRVRRGLGLKAMRKLMQWWHSPAGSISLFPEWFAASCPDMPANHQYAGFLETKTRQPYLENHHDELNRFIAQPKRLLLFYPGSNASHLQGYFQVCSQVCSKLDCKGILVAPMGKDLGSVPEHMRVFSFVDMASTLAHVDAMVHHGGIGTIRDCLKAGVPQLIRPMFADQPDNAARVAKLGVGSLIEGSRFRVDVVAAQLRELLENPQVAADCKKYQGRMRDEKGLEIASDLLEKFADASLAGRTPAP